MTKEQIEKAAEDYRMSLPYCDDPKIRGISIGGYDGFIKGAQWRINSVWHTNTEMPSIGIDEYGSGKDCLVKPKYGIIEIGQVLFDEGIYAMSCNNTTYTMDEIEAWAYLDDLLPQK